MVFDSGDHPLIFQDVDGVLNTTTSPVALDEKLIHNLVDLVNKSKARLVLSTAWRKNDTLVDQLITTLKRAGIEGPQDFSKTPSLCAGVSCRPDEIHAWLRAHRQKRWIAIDDWDLTKMRHGAFLKNHFVHTDPRLGLTTSKVQEGWDYLHPVHADVVSALES